jgi:microcystin-dependent protein
MAELTTSTSGYATGSIDTWDDQANDPAGDEIRAEHVNGLGSAVTQIETILGDGTSLKGSMTDLATRLAVQMSATGILVPIGSMTDYGGASAPTGWLLCDGTAVSRTTYVDLFGVIGTSFGTGDGSTTFNVPDRRGRVSVGVGTGAGGATSGTGVVTGGSALTAIARGAWKGAETHALTTAEMPSHSHNIEGADAAGVNSGNVARGSGATSLTMTTPILATGSGDAHNNLQPQLGVNVIIKF